MNLQLCTAILLVLLTIAVASHEATKLDFHGLYAICDDNRRVKLTRVSQLKTIARDLSAQPKLDCPQKTKEAIIDLLHLVDSRTNVFCTVPMVQQILDYYINYLAPPDAADTDTWKVIGYKLPRALKKFFIAFGLQVSNICRDKMFNSLILEAKTVLSEQDRSFMATMTDVNGVMGDIVKMNTDDSSIVLPRDLLRILKRVYEKGNDYSDERIYIQMRNGHQIRTSQEICSMRFRPIYEKSLLPSVMLTNIGLNYKSIETKSKFTDQVLADLVPWYRILYVCETLATIEVVEMPANRTERVRVLSEQEIFYYNIAKGANIIPEVHNEPRYELLSYEPQWMVSVGDLVMDQNDRRLMRYVKRFRTLNEYEGIRVKLGRSNVEGAFEKLKEGRLSCSINPFRGKRPLSRFEDVHVQSDTDELFAALKEQISKYLRKDREREIKEVLLSRQLLFGIELGTLLTSIIVVFGLLCL